MSTKDAFKEFENGIIRLIIAVIIGYSFFMFVAQNSTSIGNTLGKPYVEQINKMK